MMTSHLIAHHRHQFAKYRAYWDDPDRARQARLSEGVVAYTVLEHAGKLAELTGDNEFVDTLTDLPQHDLQKLIRAACHYADTTDIKARAAALFERDALSEVDLETFDGVLVSTDVLRSVLDTAARLADRLEEPDASIAVGERLFALDELIDVLYERPDVISVRWRAGQRPDGSVPGWLLRAKLLDDRDRATQPPAPRPRESDVQADRRLALVEKLLRATAPKCIREYRNIPLPVGRFGCADTPLLPRRLQGPNGLFELELLSGSESDSITLEFTSRGQAFSNKLFAYVLVPGSDGVGTAGFAVATPAKDHLCVAETVVPPGDVARLGGACNGITAGPVDLNALSEDDWSVVLAVARSELATPRATAWRAWATTATGTGDVPERIRAELGALANPTTS